MSPTDFTTSPGASMKTAYTNTHDEYAVLRESCGLLDYTDIGLVRVSGPGATDFLGQVATRGVEFLLEGQSMTALLLRADGTLLSEVLVHCHTGHYLVEIWPAQAAEATEHLLARGALDPDTTVQDVREEYDVLAVEGPASFSIAQKYLPFPVASMGYRSFVTTDHDGGSLTVSRTGVTGEYGYKFFAPAGAGAALRAELTASGAVECGKDAVDVCRMEVRFASVEHEAADGRATAADLGLQWMIEPGKEPAGAGDQPRRPVCWVGAEEMTERPSPGTGLTASDATVGVVTHAVWSPRLNRVIGTAQVDAAVAASGQEFALADGGTALRTVSAPFLTATSLDVALD
ncbi:glycine cleavage T C-terminal barrel domain-containing protein [Streptomyces noboritoensis]|uniref:Glycine cleavage T C-terminal barrel domain-containing protein n=1 Tax=Streptomyces noboritoensis TaxID=67337 RepID=A0ABV6TDB7_9ACTN